jgi:hypothetical protein
VTRALAVTIVALAAGTACGGERSASPGPAAPDAGTRATVLGFVWNGAAGRLRSLDARTLRPVGRGGVRGLRPATPAFSPDRRTLVLASAERPPRLRFIDLRRTRQVRPPLDLPGTGWVWTASWPLPARLLVLVAGDEPSILIVDPHIPRVLQAHRLSGTVVSADARGGRLTVLLAPNGSIGPARLAIADAAHGSVRTVALPGISAGSERIEHADDAYAVRIESPGVAVSPDGARAVVVAAGNAVAEVDLLSLRVSRHELSEPVSLLGRLRGWLEPTAHSKVAVGPSRLALWLGPHHVAVTGVDQRGIKDGEWDASAAGLRVIDTRDWSVRTRSEHVSWMVRAGSLVLAYGGNWPEGSRGTGLRALGPDGRERFHVFGDRPIGSIEVAWPYGYVAQPGGQTRPLDVVDLRSGRVVGRSSPGPQVTVFGP